MLRKKMSGFSLVELMLVVAGLAGVAVIVMQLSKNQNKTTVKGQFDSDLLLTTNEINAILSDPAKCLATLGGKNALSTTTGINGINLNKYYSVASGSAPSGGYGNSNFQIQNYELSATAADVSANNSFLQISYQNKNILKGDSGPSIIKKKINLYVEVDGSNNITKCRSLSTSTSDIWNRGTGTDSNNIFFNGGVRSGDETQTSTCDSGTEGTQRYNKATHSMEYCGYNAGPPVTYSWTSMGGAGGSVLSNGNVNLGSALNRTENITISHAGILIFTGWVHLVSYPGTAANAGVRGTLKVDGTICSEDYSFEGETSSVVFDAAPVCILPLTAGAHTLTLVGNYQTVTSYSSTMSWVVYKN